MLVEILKAVFYGIVEGVAEWLPVSSTGHLILFEEFFGFNIASLTGLDEKFTDEFLEMFAVVIQLGAILAVLVCFPKRLFPFSKDVEERKNTFSLWGKVIIASIPAAVVGLFIDKLIEKLSGRDIDGWLYNACVVSAALIIYGILFIVIEKSNKNKTPAITDISQISVKKALFIGIFQMLAMIPGTSRSGSTILGAVGMGLSRSTAAEFSFFMAIPVMLGASLVKIRGFFSYVTENELTVPPEVYTVLAIGCLTAFLVSLISIRFLTDFVKRHSFSAFGVYRIILGMLVILYFIIN